MFKEALEVVVNRTEGAVCALIIGTDGIAVERLFLPEATERNLDVAATEFTSLVKRSQRISGDIALGELSEVIIALNDYIIVARMLSPDYFMMVALRSDGNVGRARYQLRCAALLLAPEFLIGTASDQATGK